MDRAGARRDLEAEQLKRLRALIEQIHETNPFYRRRLVFNGQLGSLEDLKQIPFTTKQELVEDQLNHPPFGTDLTFPRERYIRVHQTSGTTGQPLYWLDTKDSWEWWGRCWKVIFQAAGVKASDRIYFAFSFGPFIGFWAGWEGARKLGALAISGGGQSTSQRLKAIVEFKPTVLVSTPTYALHMLSEARKAGIDLAGSAVRVTIHAGEPGASIPGTKKMIAEGWGARCYDHPGATEVGAYGFECGAEPGGVHVNEREFVAEVVNPETGAPVSAGERGELVMTNLGRVGSPVVRYRTGDLVEPAVEPCACGRPFVLLQGGVLGRVDDMIIVRGVNIFPGAIENIMRQMPEIEEFRIDAVQRDALAELKLTLEPGPEYVSFKGLGEKVTQKVRESIGLRPQVEIVPPGTLPRFELKARRFFKS